MTTTNNLPARPIDNADLLKRMAIGAGIGLILITLMVTSVKEPRLEWGRLWMIRPLIIVTLAGAGGGLGTYFMEYFLGYQGGWKKMVAVVLSLLGFLIALWLGTVLGCAGTLWN